MKSIELKLLADIVGNKPVYEMVPAMEIGPNRYRIIASPGFAPGVASGDEIELISSAKNGYRIVRRSGNICIQLFLRTCGREDREQITRIIQAIGGWLDGGFDVEGAKSGNLLIFTIPAVSGFQAIEQAMSRITDMFDVDRWMYGNVYDTSDGKTPLNWWQNIQRES